MRHLIGLGAWFAGCALAAGVSAADPPQTAPASDAQAMKIVVTAVRGLVQVRLAEDRPWLAATVGQQLTEGAEFRTGPHSAVTCSIPPDQTLTLDRLGTLKIAEAIRIGGKMKTDLVMKYGRTQYDIEAAGVEHESTIRSPSSTLAVRGTDVVLYDQPPFVPEAQSFHGRAEFRNAGRRVRFGGAHHAAISADQRGAAETELARTVVDPQSSRERTPSDLALVQALPSRSGYFFEDHFSDINVVRDGPGPVSDTRLATAALPGRLEFVLRWTGNANLNLVVGNEAGDPVAHLSSFTPHEILYPGLGLDTTPSGGQIRTDDRGGRNGGQELAFWKSGFPAGIYSVDATSLSGQTADYKLNAFLNGKPLSLFTFDPNSNFTRSTQYENTLAPRQSSAVTVIVPESSTIDGLIPGPPNNATAKSRAPHNVAPAPSVRAHR